MAILTSLISIEKLTICADVLVNQACKMEEDFVIF